ncbi:uncharacterized protein MAM_04654 [Metarhizium album ARSEF 1941]|uniref:Secreted protein NIS1 n=1 Tax=Metarhizium album (strain ARSEF 1941) TaxID=1081103 RepID=A0A0B2WVI9_METAS|nr:uncharacterized protein MAM_04654 [Metarhizium album ARSEF 1941]KHN97639.1 hypothetical protein MAM_04654 [Metarhizium album ARSEF 1941]
MRASAAVMAGILALAQARIRGIAVPETIKPGDTINVTIVNENYIQAVYDVAIAFGYAPGHGIPQSLGLVAGLMYLGPLESNQAHSSIKQLTIPKDAPQGEALLTSSLMSLYGAAHMPTLTNFNVSVTFGHETSAQYVYNQQDGCCSPRHPPTEGHSPGE